MVASNGKCQAEEMPRFGLGFLSSLDEYQGCLSKESNDLMLCVRRNWVRLGRQGGISPNDYGDSGL
jgi:hypothetical protein